MRYAHRVLAEQRALVVIYIDDILIFCKTEEEHKHHAQAVFETLREANLRLKASKCSIGTQETTFIGYRITRNGMHAVHIVSDTALGR